MARLTVSVSNETVERLRTLSGGERKIGAMVDEVTAWLWAQHVQSGRTVRDLLDATDPTQADRKLTQLEAQVANLQSQAAELSASLRIVEQRLAHEDAGDNDA